MPTNRHKLCEVHKSFHPLIKSTTLSTPEPLWILKCLRCSISTLHHLDMFPYVSFFHLLTPNSCPACECDLYFENDNWNYHLRNCTHQYAEVSYPAGATSAGVQVVQLLRQEDGHFHCILCPMKFTDSHLMSVRLISSLLSPPLPRPIRITVENAWPYKGWVLSLQAHCCKRITFRRHHRSTLPYSQQLLYHRHRVHSRHITTGPQ